MRLTNCLIVSLIAVYLGELATGLLYGLGAVQEVFASFGFSAAALAAGKWWTILSSVWLHASPEHLVLNALALFFFGRAVEAELGWRKTLLIFLTAAVVGNLAVLLMAWLGLMPMAIPTVGASGAIFGLLGTAMLIKPLEFIFYPYLIPVPLVLVAVLYTLYNVFAFLAVLAAGVSTNIAYAAHIAGLGVGALAGFKFVGAKRAFIVLLLIFAILLAIPFILGALAVLEIFNWAVLLGRILGG